MRTRMLVLALFMVCSAVVQAAGGMKTLESVHSVADTMDRLEQKVSAAGFKVFARVNHGAGAKSVNMELRPTELLIFGNPKGGTVLLQSEQTVGIDLPLKYLVWEDAAGKVQIGWNDPAWIVGRHHITDKAPVVKKMTGGLNKFASEAAKP